MASETQMHHDANMVQSSCTLSACHDVDCDARVRRHSVMQRRFTGLLPLRARSFARRPASSGSLTRARRRRKRSASVAPPSTGASCPGRDGRDAVGRTTDPGRRAAALGCGTTPARSSASKARSEPWTPGHRRARHRRADPGRARRRQESGSGRPQAQHRPSTDSARRRTVVAVDSARCSPPSRNLT
jgi:hypothetical protein